MPANWQQFRGNKVNLELVERSVAQTHRKDMAWRQRELTLALTVNTIKSQ